MVLLFQSLVRCQADPLWVFLGHCSSSGLTLDDLAWSQPAAHTHTLPVLCFDHYTQCEWVFLFSPWEREPNLDGKSNQTLSTVFAAILFLFSNAFWWNCAPIDRSSHADPSQGIQNTSKGADKTNKASMHQQLCFTISQARTSPSLTRNWASSKTHTSTGSASDPTVRVSSQKPFHFV